MNVSPVDTLAAKLRDMANRITSLERSVGVGGSSDPIDWTLGYPTYDPRYLNAAGDTATGLLALAGAGQEKLRLIVPGAGLGAFLSGHKADGATRVGYLNFIDSGDVRLASDAGVLELYGLTTVAVPNDYLVVRRPADFWSGGSDFYNVGNLGALTTNGAFRVSLASNGWRTSTGWHNLAAGGQNGSAMLDLDPSGVFLFRCQATAPTTTSGPGEAARIQAGGMLIGKTAINNFLTVNGIEMWNAGQMFSTMAGISSNLWLTHLSAADANNVSFARFYRTGSSLIGSITQNGTTGVNYNATSAGELKGNVEDLDDDEAIARVERWRPVSFQWLMDESGAISAKGDPQGPRQHGFIAEEMADLEPHAANASIGTPEEHDEWVLKVDAYAEACAQRQAIIDRNEQRMVEWQQTCADIAALPEQVERVTDSGIIAVENVDRVFPPQPELDDVPDEPEHPGEDPYMPGGGDWAKLVPTLSAAVQALIRQNRALTERVAQLEARKR